MAKDKRDWRELPPVELSADLRNRLARIMPGMRSQLDRHQWVKHGSCSGLSTERYFAAAASLTESATKTDLSALIVAKSGKDVLRRDPEHAPALNFVGYIQAERGVALEESEALVRKALEVEPDNGYYVDSLEWVLYQRGPFDSAVETLERAVALTQEQDAIILEHLGDAYVKAGRTEQALRAYARAHALAPDNGAVRAKIDSLETHGGKP